VPDESESPVSRGAPFDPLNITMAHSFTPTESGLAKTTPAKRKVLVTGAGGNIGSYFAEHSHEKYELLLMEHHLDDDARAVEKFGKLVQGDVTDLARMKELTRGIDTVLHLAANPMPQATWDELLQPNIVGAYNTMVAAKAAGCRRFIYASSIHAVSGYPADVQVKTTEPVNPGDLYGVTKCFGEALARYMAEQEGLSCICIRIGAFQPIENARKDESIAMFDAWVSHSDLNQLIQKCIDVENLKFAVLHGLSDNRFKRLDISDARQLVGYEPADDLTEEHPILKGLHLDESVHTHSLADMQKSGLRKHL